MASSDRKAVEPTLRRVRNGWQKIYHGTKDAILATGEVPDEWFPPKGKRGNELVVDGREVDIWHTARGIYRAEIGCTQDENERLEFQDSCGKLQVAARATEACLAKATGKTGTRAVASPKLPTPTSPTLPRSGRFVAHRLPSSHMAPALAAGDLVEIDTEMCVCHTDGIYLIAFPVGEPALRRVQLVMRGTRKMLRIWTDAAPEAADLLEPDQVVIVGRVRRALREVRL